MLENKVALIYGGGGAVGGAVARAFADAGAQTQCAAKQGTDWSPELGLSIVVGAFQLLPA